MYSLRHLTDPILLRDCAAIASRDHGNGAVLLAHLAEIDARRLYAPAGYDSMYRYCVEALRLSEDTALLRIRVARVALQFPAIFPALAEGRLHLSSVMMLKPFLTAESADELLSAASGKSKSEISLLLAERFPRPDVPTRIERLATPQSQELRQLVPEPVATMEPASALPTRVAPLAPERFELQATIAQGTRDLLREAQDLLGHRVARGDVDAVLNRALKGLVRELKQEKFGATERPRTTRRASRNPRYIPAHVKREVWERDGGQCTFVGDAGRRCQSRTRLEFDHVNEVARGGKSTVSNVRLLCRAHNQYGAERTFGSGFMDWQRREAAEARAGAKSRAAADADAEDVIPWLRQLGFRADEARRAAARCELMKGAPLEERVRTAISFLAPAARRDSSALSAG